MRTIIVAMLIATGLPLVGCEDAIKVGYLLGKHHAEMDDDMPGDAVCGDTEVSADGTWTDPDTGLTWQVAHTGGKMSDSAAKSHCSDLDLAGGGWRLPTIGELGTLIRGCPATEDGGICSLGYGPACGCYWPYELAGTCAEGYWSSSYVKDDPKQTWGINFSSGSNYSRFYNPLTGYDKDLARCVR